LHHLLAALDERLRHPLELAAENRLEARAELRADVPRADGEAHHLPEHLDDLLARELVRRGNQHSDLPRLALQDLPHTPHVGLRRPRVADRKAQNVTALELRVREKYLAGAVDALEERLVRLVGGVAPEADKREPARRGELPAVSVAHPALEELGQPHVLADPGLQPLAAEAAKHRPQLQRAEATAERGAVVGE